MSSRQSIQKSKLAKQFIHSGNIRGNIYDRLQALTESCTLQKIWGFGMQIIHFTKELTEKYFLVRQIIHFTKDLT